MKTLRRLAWIRLSLTALAELLSAPAKIRRDLTPSQTVCRVVNRFMTSSGEGDVWSNRLHLFLFKVLDRAAGFQAVCDDLRGIWNDFVQRQGRVGQWKRTRSSQRRFVAWLFKSALAFFGLEKTITA